MDLNTNLISTINCALRAPDIASDSDVTKQIDSAPNEATSDPSSLALTPAAGSQLNRSNSFGTHAATPFTFTSAIPSASSMLKPKAPPIIDEATAIRTKIARVLSHIQCAANPTVTINSFRPIAIAFQLCLIEQTLLRKIHPTDLLAHRPPHSPCKSLQASSEFFNYFTRVVECSVLEPSNPADRCKNIVKWIKVALKLRKFNNFQSLKAVVCALMTPPISRLKRTWSLVKRKPEFTDFTEMRNLLSEESNYAAYRDWLKTSLTRPMIPFLGLLIHDTTYVITVSKRDGVDPTNDKRYQDIQRQLRYCTSGPRYSYEVLSALDAASQSNKKAIQFRRRVVGGLSDQGIEELPSLRDLNEEEIGTFISHWILSRSWISEKEVDDLSLAREPRLTPLPTSHSAHTMSVSSKGTDVSRRSTENEGRDHEEIGVAGHGASQNDPDDAFALVSHEEDTDSLAAHDKPSAQSLTSIPATIDSSASSSSRGIPAVKVRSASASSGSSNSSSMANAASSLMSPPVVRKRVSTSSAIMDAIRGTAYSMVPKTRPTNSTPPLVRRSSRERQVVDLGDDKDDSPDDEDIVDYHTHARAKHAEDRYAIGDKSASNEDWSLDSLKSISMEISLNDPSAYLQVQQDTDLPVKAISAPELPPRRSTSTPPTYRSVPPPPSTHISNAPLAQPPMQPATQPTILINPTTATASIVSPARRGSFFTFPTFTAPPVVDKKDPKKAGPGHKKLASVDQDAPHRGAIESEDDDDWRRNSGSKQAPTSPLSAPKHAASTPVTDIHPVGTTSAPNRTGWVFQAANAKRQLEPVAAPAKVNAKPTRPPPPPPPPPPLRPMVAQKPKPPVPAKPTTPSPYGSNGSLEPPPLPPKPGKVSSGSTPAGPSRLKSAEM
ncbi:hypothetical protein HK101_009681 [Irineochytrium annulatum]|nr:hypothetical protein HK101_009681 [Irineochytrium annulatum]